MAGVTKRLLVTLGCAIGVVVVAYALPIATEEERFTSVRNATSTVLLSPGDTLTQTIRVAGDTVKGLVLYSQDPWWGDRELVVRIQNAAGQEIAHSSEVAASYFVREDSLRLAVALPWFRRAQNEVFAVTVELTDGPPLSLKVSPHNSHSGGVLTVDGVVQPGDLALRLLHPSILSFGARQGAVAATVFVLCAMLIVLLVPSRRQWWAAAGLLVLITPLALGGFWFSKGELGVADWDYYFSLHEVYRRTISIHHSLPLWNPYTCGGTAGLADPEFPVLAPTFLLELLFGIPVGLKLSIWFSVAMGGCGLLLLAKQLRLSVLAGLLVAVAGMFSSVSLLEMVEGHVNVFAAMWIPWIFWSWLGAYRKNVKMKNQNEKLQSKIKNFYEEWLKPTPRTLLLSLFLALAFYQGGIYLLSYTALAFVVLIALVARKKAAFRITWLGGIWALGLVAVKLVPVLLWLRQYPDPSYASSTFTLPGLIDILFGRYVWGDYVLFDQESGWHEYGAYVGYGILFLSLVGLSWWRSRAVRVLGISVVIAVLLSATGPALKSVFDVIPYIPRSNVSRVILFAVLPLCLLAGFGLDRLRSLRGGVYLRIGLLAFVAADLMSLSYQLSQQAFVLPPVYPVVRPASAPLAFTRNRFDARGEGSRETRTYAATVVGYGTFAYCSVLGPAPMVRTVHDEGDSSVIATHPQARAWQLLRWMPHLVEGKVRGAEKSEIILNTNFAPGWYFNGVPAHSFDGRVAGTVPAGEHEVVFSYHPPGLWVGLSITLLTLSTLLYLYVPWTKVWGAAKKFTR